MDVRWREKSDDFECVIRPESVHGGRHGMQRDVFPAGLASGVRYGSWESNSGCGIAVLADMKKPRAFLMDQK